MKDMLSCGSARKKWRGYIPVLNSLGGHQTVRGWRVLPWQLRAELTSRKVQCFFLKGRGCGGEGAKGKCVSKCVGGQRLGFMEEAVIQPMLGVPFIYHNREWGSMERDGDVGVGADGFKGNESYAELNPEPFKGVWSRSSTFEYTF